VTQTGLADQGVNPGINAEPPAAACSRLTAEPSAELSCNVSSLDLVMSSEDGLDWGPFRGIDQQVLRLLVEMRWLPPPLMVLAPGLVWCPGSACWKIQLCRTLAGAFDVQAVAGDPASAAPAAGSPQAGPAVDSTLAGSSEEILPAHTLTMFMSSRSEFTFSSDDPDGPVHSISRNSTVPGAAVQCSALGCVRAGELLSHQP